MRATIVEPVQQAKGSSSSNSGPSNKPPIQLPSTGSIIKKKTMTTTQHGGGSKNSGNSFHGGEQLVLATSFTNVNKVAMSLWQIGFKLTEDKTWSSMKEHIGKHLEEWHRENCNSRASTRGLRGSHFKEMGPSGELGVLHDHTRTQAGKLVLRINAMFPNNTNNGPQLGKRKKSLLRRVGSVASGRQSSSFCGSPTLSSDDEKQYNTELKIPMRLQLEDSQVDLQEKECREAALAHPTLRKLLNTVWKLLPKDQRGHVTEIWHHQIWGRFFDVFAFDVWDPFVRRELVMNDWTARCQGRPTIDGDQFLKSMTLTCDAWCETHDPSEYFEFVAAFGHIAKQVINLVRSGQVATSFYAGMFALKMKRSPSPENTNTTTTAATVDDQFLLEGEDGEEGLRDDNIPLEHEEELEGVKPVSTRPKLTVGDDGEYKYQAHHMIQSSLGRREVDVRQIPEENREFATRSLVSFVSALNKQQIPHFAGKKSMTDRERIIMKELRKQNVEKDLSNRLMEEQMENRKLIAEKKKKKGKTENSALLVVGQKSDDGGGVDSEEELCLKPRGPPPLILDWRQVKAQQREGHHHHHHHHHERGGSANSNSTGGGGGGDDGGTDSPAVQLPIVVPDESAFSIETGETSSDDDGSNASSEIILPPTTEPSMGTVLYEGDINGVSFLNLVALEEQRELREKQQQREQQLQEQGGAAGGKKKAGGGRNTAVKFQEDDHQPMQQGALLGKAKENHHVTTTTAVGRVPPTASEGAPQSFPLGSRHAGIQEQVDEFDDDGNNSDEEESDDDNNNGDNGAWKEMKKKLPPTYTDIKKQFLKDKNNFKSKVEETAVGSFNMLRRRVSSIFHGEHEVDDDQIRTLKENAEAHEMLDRYFPLLGLSLPDRLRNMKRLAGQLESFASFHIKANRRNTAQKSSISLSALRAKKYPRVPFSWLYSIRANKDGLDEFGNEKETNAEDDEKAEEKRLLQGAAAGGKESLLRTWEPFTPAEAKEITEAWFRGVGRVTIESRGRKYEVDLTKMLVFMKVPGATSNNNSVDGPTWEESSGSDDEEEGRKNVSGQDFADQSASMRSAVFSLDIKDDAVLVADLCGRCDYFWEYNNILGSHWTPFSASIQSQLNKWLSRVKEDGEKMLQEANEKEGSGGASRLTPLQDASSMTFLTGGQDHSDEHKHHTTDTNDKEQDKRLQKRHSLEAAKRQQRFFQRLSTSRKRGNDSQDIDHQKELSEVEFILMMLQPSGSQLARIEAEVEEQEKVRRAAARSPGGGSDHSGVGSDNAGSDREGNNKSPVTSDSNGGGGGARKSGGKKASSSPTGGGYRGNTTGGAGGNGMFTKEQLSLEERRKARTLPDVYYEFRFVANLHNVEEPAHTLNLKTMAMLSLSSDLLKKSARDIRYTTLFIDRHHKEDPLRVADNWVFASNGEITILDGPGLKSLGQAVEDNHRKQMMMEPSLRDKEQRVAFTIIPSVKVGIQRIPLKIRQQYGMTFAAENLKPVELLHEGLYGATVKHLPASTSSQQSPSSPLGAIGGGDSSSLLGLGDPDVEWSTSSPGGGVDGITKKRPGTDDVFSQVIPPSSPTATVNTNNKGALVTTTKGALEGRITLTGGKASSLGQPMTHSVRYIVPVPQSLVEGRQAKQRYDRLQKRFSQVVDSTTPGQVEEALHKSLASKIPDRSSEALALWPEPKDITAKKFRTVASGLATRPPLSHSLDEVRWQSNAYKLEEACKLQMKLDGAVPAYSSTRKKQQHPTGGGVASPGGEDGGGVTPPPQQQPNSPPATQQSQDPVLEGAFSNAPRPLSRATTPSSWCHRQSTINRHQSVVVSTLPGVPPPSYAQDQDHVHLPSVWGEPFSLRATSPARKGSPPRSPPQGGGGGGHARLLLTGPNAVSHTKVVSSHVSSTRLSTPSTMTTTTATAVNNSSTSGGGGGGGGGTFLSSTNRSKLSQVRSTPAFNNQSFSSPVGGGDHYQQEDIVSRIHHNQRPTAIKKNLSNLSKSRVATPNSNLRLLHVPLDESSFLFHDSFLPLSEQQGQARSIHRPRTNSPSSGGPAPLRGASRGGGGGRNSTSMFHRPTSTSSSSAGGVIGSFVPISGGGLGDEGEEDHFPMPGGDGGVEESQPLTSSSIKAGGHRPVSRQVDRKEPERRTFPVQMVRL